MKAVVQDRYGSPEHLRILDIPEPAVGERDVLVRVRAAPLHPDVWHVVTGRPGVLRIMGGGFSRPKNPVPGMDMAGVVVRTGKNATRFKPGDEVFGETLPRMAWANGGAFAELATAPEECLAPKPANVTFEQAASVPVAGHIALFNLPALDRLGGWEVLVNGAGGGVGSTVLQIAKAYGARVTAVDTTGKLDMLRALGADRVIDFTREDPAGDATRYDFILDVPANRPVSDWKRILKPAGRYVPIAHDFYGRAGKGVLGQLPRFIFLLLIRARFDRQLGSGRKTGPPKREVMRVLRELLERGLLTPVIDRTYALEEAHAAFRHLTGDELHGKVVLTV